MDAVGQIRYILSNPAGYLVLFFKVLLQNFVKWFFGDNVAAIGHLGSIGTPWYVCSLISIVLCILCSTLYPEPYLLKARTRIGFLLIGGLTVGAVCSAMYVSFTPVGTGVINGVQGRYMTPILPLLLSAVFFPAARIKLPPRTKNFSAPFAAAVLLFAANYGTIYTSVLQHFCR